MDYFAFAAICTILMYMSVKGPGPAPGAQREGTMISVSISRFRAHMTDYLAQVDSGQVVALTSRGNVVAEIRKPGDRRRLARRRLEEIAAGCTVLDVESPAVEDWGNLR